MSSNDKVNWRKLEHEEINNSELFKNAINIGKKMSNFDFDSDVYIYEKNIRNIIIMIEEVFIKIYENINYFNKEIMILKNLDFDFESDISHKIIATRKVHGEHLSGSKVSNEQIYAAIESMKTFWQRNENLLSNQEFYRKFDNKRKNIILDCFEGDAVEILKVIDEWEKNTSSKKVFCHGDLNSGNIIYFKNYATLIDFEFSSENEQYFDLSSFIVENELNLNQIKFIVGVMNLKKFDDLILNVKIFSIRTCIDWYIKYSKNENDLNKKKFLKKKKSVYEFMKI